jgi:hypothetical protein
MYKEPRAKSGMKPQTLKLGGSVNVPFALGYCSPSVVMTNMEQRWNDNEQEKLDKL